MRLMIVAAMVLLIAGLSACSSCPEAQPYGAAPDDDCGPVYAGTYCPSTAPFEAFDQTLDNWFGCPQATPIASQVVPACPPVTPLAAAPIQWGPCGPPPPEALPGENWCCVKVQPAAAPPRQVCVEPECQICIPVAAVYETQCEQVMAAPARTEWQRVECLDQPDAQCWKLVEIPPVYQTIQKEVCVQPASTRYETKPARYEMVASAPPPAYWEWRKVDNCVPPPAALVNSPPAGPIGTID